MCQPTSRHSNRWLLCALVLVALSGLTATLAAEEPVAKAAEPRATQPSIDRQLDTPASSASSDSPVAGKSQSGPKEQQVMPKSSGGANQPAARQPGSLLGAAINKQSLSTPKKSTSSVAAAGHQNYDKYQLKATNSHSSESANLHSSSSAVEKEAEKGATASPSKDSSSDSLRLKEESAQKKAAGAGSIQASGSPQQQSSANSNNNNKAKPSFSLLKKLLPSFMTSGAGGVAAAAAAAASVAVNSADRHPMSHSRSGGSALMSADGSPLLSKVSGKIINLLGSKKSAAVGGSVPDHAPFFIRKPSIDRQASFASGLLSNPLGLGGLFLAPLIPSLLLTPLAIAGLSPAMSAINNFFGDDDEPSAGATPASSAIQAAATGPLSSLLAGSSSPLSTLMQATGASSSSSSSPAQTFGSLAMQSLLGTPQTTEKPLFNPGLFAQASGIQNAVAPLSGATSSSSGSSSSSQSSSSSSSSGPIRSLLGGNSLIQTAASFISPSFAAPPTGSGSSSSSSNSAPVGGGDDDSLIQMASGVFDRFANYIGSDRDSSSSSGISQASASGSGQQQQQNTNSPLSTLVSLSSFSPFQLSSLFASSPLASAISGVSPSSISSSSGSGTSSSSAANPAKPGFFSTLKNVYELFSSGFLRRSHTDLGTLASVAASAGAAAANGADSNECQQRLICELHQRAMNSKLFRRSIQSNLMELAQIDKSLQEQIKSLNPSMQARIDADTKAMLSDFLRASNNFKQGRELVNCSKMFPKCSRAMLLSVANAHLSEATAAGGANSGKSIGKFSSLMKKMKFKSTQQHQQQTKLVKQLKDDSIIHQQLARMPLNANANANQQQLSQATDFMQVVPLSSIPASAGAPGAKSTQLSPDQMSPADSLKLMQQILMMSQQLYQQQPQPAQQSPVRQQQSVQYPQSYSNGQMMQQPAASYANNGQDQPQMYQQQSSQIPSVSYQNYAQANYNQQSGAQPVASSNPVYTDPIGPLYSSTDSPYYMQPQQQPQQQQPQQVSQQQASTISDLSMYQSNTTGPQYSRSNIDQQQYNQMDKKAPMINGQPKAPAAIAA